MPLSLSEILTARLEHLGKTAYWLADEVGYDVKNVYKVLAEKRALPEEFVAPLIRALQWDADSEEAKQLRAAIEFVRMTLKRDVAPSAEALQREVTRLTLELERSHHLLTKQRGQLAALREQRESLAVELAEVRRQLTEAISQYGRAAADKENLAKVVAEMQGLVAKLRGRVGKTGA